MEMRKLGNTDIDVSKICLGTMTWGEQNTLEQAHSQLDMAFDYGVNFIDTAEMYPVPPKEKTYSLTEGHIGKWQKLKTHREKIILATKVTGPAPWANYMRDGSVRLDKKNIETAIDASLNRLGTDYVDLYQLHWPDRTTNYFGQRGFNPDSNDEIYTPILETLKVLEGLQKAGKVRHFGLSNETPWGTMTFLALAKEHNLPRMVSIQNPYNLLNRSYEVGMSEISYREKCGLLAYSPLAFGVLTGKYLNGQRPEGARLTKWERFNRYTSENANFAAQRYVQLAKDHGLIPSQMALSFVSSRPFVTSNIIGATNLEQLKSNLESSEITLSQDVLIEIEKIQENIPNPCP